MLYPVDTPLAVSVGDDFMLRTLGSPDDLPRIAALMGRVFGPEVERWTLHMYPIHPDLVPADVFFVETAAGEVVSTLSLFPWSIRYGAATLPVGEMAIVGTDAAYRRRGLVAAQVRYFKERLAQRGCLLSIIQGIPFYYRQFGYDYAWPLEGGWRLELRQAPAEGDPTYTVRDATCDEIPTLARLYDEATADLTVSVTRSRDLWHYLLERGDEPHATTRRTLVVCDTAGDIVAYVRLPDFHFGNELVVDEGSRCTLEAARTIFAFLRCEAEAAARPFIRLNLPATHDLVRIARAWGGVDQGTYSWQLHVPDLPALLRGMMPELNRRLAASVFARYTATVALGFYCDGLTLRFDAGRLVEVSDLSPIEKANISLPPVAFMPLVLGHRPLHELRRAFPDVNARGDYELLLETLFPPAAVFLYPVS
jgi:predicted N-acetyltransferase YhbS